MQATQNNQTVCMLGCGAWGTAVAMLLAENGYTVKLWCHEKEVADAITTNGYNEQYLPGVKLHTNIIATHDLEDALCGTQVVFEATPVKFLRSVLQEASYCISTQQIWVILSKGIEQETLLLPSQIIDDVFRDVGNGVIHKVVFSGPSFAHDLVRKQITAVTIAANDCDVARTVQAMLANSYFRPYIALDPIGAQVGGALKNVIALGVGMLDGAGYTDNAKAFLLTRGLDEMKQLTVMLGGKPETLQGLSGIGDLVLTAMGRLSRNLTIGRQFGKGARLDFIAQNGNLPEGVGTCKSVYQIIQKNNLDLPICLGVYAVIFEGKSVQQMMQELMALPLGNECTTDSSR